MIWIVHGTFNLEATLNILYSTQFYSLLITISSILHPTCLGYCFSKHKSCINIATLGSMVVEYEGKGEKNVKGIEDCVCFEYRSMVKWSLSAESADS